MTSSRAVTSSPASGSTRGTLETTTNARRRSPRPLRSTDEALEAAGGFDDDYYLYCEDGDACLRMLLCGYSASTSPSRRRSTSGAERSALNRAASLLSGPERPDHPAQGHAGLDPAALAAKIALYQYGRLIAARKEGGPDDAAGLRSVYPDDSGDAPKASGRPARAQDSAEEFAAEPDGLSDADASGTLPPMRTAVALILFRRPRRTARVFERVVRRVPAILPDRRRAAAGPRGRGARLRANPRRGRIGRLAVRGRSRLSPTRTWG